MAAVRVLLGRGSGSCGGGLIWAGDHLAVGCGLPVSDRAERLNFPSPLVASGDRVVANR